MNTLFKLCLLACAAASCGCSTVAESRREAGRSLPIGVTPRNAKPPLIDAHQHIMGPAAMMTLSRQPSPASVAVPAALDALLRAREAPVDGGAFDAVYTHNAQVFAEDEGRWWQGRERVLDAVGSFGSRHTFVPTSFAADGDAGYVAGLLRSDSGEETHNFVLGVVRLPDRTWRIATEMKQALAPTTYPGPVDAKDVIAVLDDAGIRYATVLSTAYWFGNPEKNIEDRWKWTRIENDWVIEQTQQYPDRLIPFCGVNPVDDYALAELERCAANPAVRGMKIHRNSRFSTADPQQLAKLKEFFRAANEHRLAIVIHLRDMPKTLIEELLPLAPDVVVQIAHMGSGMASLAAFADAIEAGKPGTRNLWFDWTQALPIETLWTHGNPGGRIGGALALGEAEEMVALMRRIGLGRILYGSDMPLPWNPSPRDWWRKSILTLPLTDAEVHDIADNLPDYVR